MCSKRAVFGANRLEPCLFNHFILDRCLIGRESVKIATALEKGVFCYLASTRCKAAPLIVWFRIGTLNCSAVEQFDGLGLVFLNWKPWQLFLSLPPGTPGAPVALVLPSARLRHRLREGGLPVDPGHGQYSRRARHSTSRQPIR